MEPANETMHNRSYVCNRVENGIMPTEHLAIDDKGCVDRSWTGKGSL